MTADVFESLYVDRIQLNKMLYLAFGADCLLTTLQLPLVADSKYKFQFLETKL